MKRQITDKIFFDLKTEYIKWLECKDKLKEKGYTLSENSTVVYVAEKEIMLEIENIEDVVGE